MLNELKSREKEAFIPNQDTMDFILKWYKAFDEDRQLKDEAYRCLGNINLADFWQNCRDDYNNIVPYKSKKDWKKQAVRGITRDKANGFIAKITSKFIKSQVLAQNKDQKIDQTMSRMFGILLDWWLRLCQARRNFIDIVQTAVIEGTVHVQQNIINGREIREIIPNDEVYVPNFKQPDVQKQSHFIRCQVCSYEEAKLIWGDNDNWKYVMPGISDKWNIDHEYFQGYETGIQEDNEVMITTVWEHKGYDKKNNPKPKIYNVLISGIPMYDIDYKMPLKHNRYPEKGVFEKFADTTFYWGNSLPNKIKHDKKYLDAFRTIILNKAILNLLPPLFNKGQEHIDEDVIVPAKITPTQLEEGDIFSVPGVSDPITQGDLNIEDIVERSISEATQPPTSLGQESDRQATLGEIQLKDSRAAELLKTFGQFISFLVEDLDTQSLSNIIQFETKKGIQALVDGSELLFQKEIEIPEQTLNNGKQGILALRLGEGKFPPPIEIAQEEYNTGKEIIYAKYKYIEELDKYVYVSANPVDKPSETLERLIAVENYKAVYFNNPFINQLEAVRNVVRANRDDEEKLINEQAINNQQAELRAGKETPPTERMKQSIMPKNKMAGQLI